MKHTVLVLILPILIACTYMADDFNYSALPAAPELGAYANQMNAVAGYKYGDSRESLMVVENLIRAVSDDWETTNALADDMAVTLLLPRTTRDAKEFICRQLWIIGGDEHAPYIASLLKSADTADMARYALVNITGPTVDGVLIEALDDAPDVVKVGILNSLGDRGANGVLSNVFGVRRAIRPLRNASHEGVAAAARDALKRI